MKVLLIDDEKLAVDAMEYMIPWEQFGIHDIYKAYSAKQAQQICQNNEIDIIFCDIEMPRVSGLDFVAELRKEGEDVVVIFLTSHAVFHYAQQAVHLEVQEYLLKPIDREEMCAALQKAVKKAEKSGRKDIQINGSGNCTEISVRWKEMCGLCRSISQNIFRNR